MIVRIYNFNDELIEVPWFQLIQWKHSISLEMLGLRNSRGSVTAHVRRVLNAPKSVKRQAIFKHLADSVADILQQREAS